MKLNNKALLKAVRGSCLLMLAVTSLIGSILITAAPITYTVTNTEDHGPGSLRHGIRVTNSNIGFRNTIDFAIPMTDPNYNPTTDSWLIKPSGNLPTITNPLVIDGYTQTLGIHPATPNTNPITAPNNAVIKIEIRGPGAGNHIPGPLNGLTLGVGSDGSLITGLAINNFAKFADGVSGIGIEIDSTLNTIAGNFIGCDVTGEMSLPNFTGIAVLNSNNTIGGLSLGARNLLVGVYGGSSNGVVVINGPSNTIQGNTIGLDRAGTVGLMPDAGVGIVANASNSTIITGNAIAGNRYMNIFIQDCDDLTISDNYIGTDVSGTRSVVENGNGIIIINFSINNPINAIISGNVLSGMRYGIRLGSGNLAFFPVVGVQILDNLIGTNAAGNAAIPNTLDGIWVEFALNTYIAGNTISGNGRHGIRTGKGKNTTIKSNFIGTDATGTVALGNGANGIQLGTMVAAGVPSFGDIVGGGKPDEANYILYNKANGIEVFGYTEQAIIQGNIILFNDKNGILLNAYSQNSIVGGFRTKGDLRILGDTSSQDDTNLGPLGISNYIEANGQDGIRLVRSNHNTIQSNYDEGNSNNGISLVDSSENLIGEPSSGPAQVQELGNTITDNGGFGVAVIKNTPHGCAINNAILTNSIVNNTKDGIKLVNFKKRK